MTSADFVLAGLTSWAPLQDRPSIMGPHRWFLESWTGCLPSNEVFSDEWAIKIEAWPRNFDQQINLALQGSTVVLVSGDPLIATPHEHLLKHLRSKGLSCLVRRRPGVIDLVATHCGQRPRLLPASAHSQISEHLATRTDPLLVVEDDQGEDLWDLGRGWQGSDWKAICYADLGTPQSASGPLHRAPDGQLRCLVFQRALELFPAP